MKPALLRFVFRVLATTLLLSASIDAHAFDYRRPNLVGQYTDRRITNPLNAMTVIAGPTDGHAFGQRYNRKNMEAGIQYARNALPGVEPQNEAWSRFGIVFGLLPYLDAGAVFLNFKYAPDFEFTEVWVFVTHAWNFGDWELGARFSFITPGPPGWEFNPGALAVYRGGGYRIETGLFSAFGTGSLLLETTEDKYFGLNAPVRGVVNITPQLFAGLETGFAVPDFGETERSTIPLGALLGFSVVNGNRLIDLTASIKWDEFLYVASPSGVDPIQAGHYRVNFGVNLHRMAVPPRR